MRIPSKSRLVSELAPKDKRVRVYGTLVSVNSDEGKIIVDDGTASVDVFLNNLDLIEKIKSYKPGNQIIVVGWAGESGVDGEVVRKISDFDPDRYKQVLEVWKNVRSENEQPGTDG